MTQGSAGGAGSARLSAGLWLVAPLACVAGVVLTAAVDRGAVAALVAKDEAGGPIELLTIVVLVPALLAGLSMLRHREHLPHRFLAPWIVLCTLAAAYFAGEEASWGQWWFGWETPAAWAQWNRQGETNLHNLHPLLGRHPRTLVEIAMLLGGVVMPLVHRRRPPDPASLGSWLWPTFMCLPTAALTQVVRGFRPLSQALDAGWLHPAGSSEVRELLTAWFVLLYLLSLRRRLAAARRTGSSQPLTGHPRGSASGRDRGE